MKNTCTRLSIWMSRVAYPDPQIGAARASLEHRGSVRFGLGECAKGHACRFGWRVSEVPSCRCRASNFWHGSC